MRYKVTMTCPKCDFEQVAFVDGLQSTRDLDDSLNPARTHSLETGHTVITHIGTESEVVQ